MTEIDYIDTDIDDTIILLKKRYIEKPVTFYSFNNFSITELYLFMVYGCKTQFIKI
jgi:hypothetical protein